MVCVAPTAGDGGACGERRAGDGKIGSSAKTGEAQTIFVKYLFQIQILISKSVKYLFKFQILISKSVKYLSESPN